jgi:DNA-binding CsgD family transcriptional regulator
LHRTDRRALIEREAESDGLNRHLAGARAGDGGVIYVEGPAGAGKSRLLAFAADSARDEGMLVLKATAHELERNYPFGIATRLLEESSLAAEADGRAQLLDGSARSAHRWLIRTGDDDRPVAQDDGGFAVIHGLYALVRAVTRPAAAGETGRAVALVVDDVNRADDPSLRWLAYLSSRITELPVAIVLSARTGEPSTNLLASTALREAAGAGVLRPGELSADAVDKIVEAELPGAGDALWQSCAQATGGNPFLLTELLAELRRVGPAEATRLADRLDSVAPESITRSVRSQLETLGAPAAQVAFAVAVLGDDASLARAADLAELDLTDAGRGADALTATHVLRAGAPLAFRHPIVATAVRAAIPSFQRDRMTRRAGSSLLPPDIPAASPSIPVGTHGHNETGSAGQRAAEKLIADELERCLEIVGDVPGPGLGDGSSIEQAADGRSRAWSLYHQGRVREAVTAAQAGLDALPVDERARAHGLNGAFAACSIQLGELDQADAALSMLLSPGDVPDTELPVLFDVRAQLRLAQRRAGEAAEDAEEAGARARSVGAGSHPGIVAWRSTAAFARLALSEPLVAEQLAEEELALARETDIPRVTIRALRALGLAATGERRLDLLAEAVDAGRDRPVRLEFLHALVDLGAATRRANRRTAAREILDEALELCRHHGATALAQQALEEIAGTGAPRRQPHAVGGVGSLTPSERRVAELAADGRTTQQIAAELFVTSKTVEFHLRHIYRKLEVASTRAELTKAVRAGGLTAGGDV